MHGGLAGRIGSADDVDGFAAAGDGFRCAATVVDAGALEALDTGNIQSAPLNTHREKQSIAGNFGAIGKLDETIGAVDAEANYVLRGKNFDTKAAGLRYSAK